MDWDDVEGNQRRRLAGLKREKQRQDASRRLRVETKEEEKKTGVNANDKALRAMGMGSGAKPLGPAAKKF